MPETIDDQNMDLETLKDRLPYGGQRELARRLGCLPDKVSKALDGFVRDIEFMASLQAKAIELINESETAALSGKS